MNRPDARVQLSPLQMLGGVVVLASLVLTAMPTLVHDPGPAPDLFEATERHVRWGLGAGLGAMLVADRWRRPWSVLIAWLAFCLSGGYLVARILGMFMVGPTDPKQWLLVGIEVAICATAAFWIRRRRDVPDRR